MVRCACLILLALALSAPPSAQAPRRGSDFPVDLAWSRSSVWDDGQAEVAHYDSRRSVYGVERAFETVMITVKEDFDASLGVKADAPLEGRSLITVLKMNLISRIPTENYPYDYLTSVFVRRDDPRVLVKLAGSSQEWCGTTFKEIVNWDGPPRLRFHSYFDGQADGERPLDLTGGALLEEQLFLVLRAAGLAPGRPHRFMVYDSLIGIQAPEPHARYMSASLEGEERVATSAGVFETRRFHVGPLEVRVDGSPGLETEPAGPTFTFWIDKRPEHLLVKMTSSDGRSHTLKSVSRRKYWVRPPASR